LKNKRFWEDWKRNGKKRKRNTQKGKDDQTMIHSFIPSFAFSCVF